MEKRGTSHSEQNHSSIVSLIGPQFSDDLVHQLQRMLNRQRQLAISRQRELSEYIMLLPSRIQNIKSKYPGQEEVLSEAAYALSPWAFELFAIELIKSKDYQAYVDNGTQKVSYQPKPDAQPCILSGRCSCLTRRSFLLQCRHEICSASGKFDLGLFDARWKRDYDESHVIWHTGMFVIQIMFCGARSMFSDSTFTRCDDFINK